MADDQMQDQLIAETDAVFLAQLRTWIEEFQEALGPLDEQATERRLRGYLNQEELYAETVRFILHQVARPGRALDIGSSTGGLSVALGLAGLEVDGVEPSEAGVIASVTRARRHGLSERVRFQVGYGEQLPYADASFDLVVSIAVLEHVQDVARVLAETFRVLRPGGYAYFEVPNNLCPFEGHYKLPWLPMMPKSLACKWVRLHGRDPGFLDHLHYMSRGIASRAFRNAGFEVLGDVYGDYMLGRAFGAPWSNQPGRLASRRWSRPAVAAVYSHAPLAWFASRAVAMVARRPAL